MGYDRKKKLEKNQAQQIQQSKKKQPVPKTVLLYYVQLVKSRIYAQWIIPATLRAKQNMDTVTVRIKISRNGTLESVQFIRKSENELLNRSIQDAIYNSRPFPPFPADLTDHSMDITIHFDTQQ